MNNNLSIKLIKQHPESDDCYRCCLEMIFRYFNDQISHKEIWKKLHVYKNHLELDTGAYPQDLGVFALKKGYKVDLCHGDWQYWDAKTVEAAKEENKEKLIHALERLFKHKEQSKKYSKQWKDRRVVEKDLKFIEQGGKYLFQLPSLWTINSYLQKGIPPVLGVRAEDLYHDPDEDYGHAIIVSGKEEGTYFLKDPYLALKKISGKELLYAWARNGGWMIAIYK